MCEMQFSERTSGTALSAFKLKCLNCTEYFCKKCFAELHNFGRTYSKEITTKGSFKNHEVIDSLQVVLTKCADHNKLYEFYCTQVS